MIGLRISALEKALEDLRLPTRVLDLDIVEMGVRTTELLSDLSPSESWFSSLTPMKMLERASIS